MQMLFSMEFEEVDKILDKQSENLRKQGIPNNVILSYQTVAPLLLEHEAITSWLMRNSRMDLRTAFPEVMTIREALILMQMEYMLTVEEVDVLQEMLGKMYRVKELSTQ
jgi:hypothetical protein